MIENNVCIISRHHYQFWCKTCKYASNKVYKANGESYCDKCVPKNIKNKCVLMNQNREIINGEK